MAATRRMAIIEYKRKKEKERRYAKLKELGLLEEYKRFKEDSDRECFSRFGKLKGIEI